MQYDWPGNVRELRNVCERLIVLNDSDFVSAGLLRQLKIFRESKAREPVILPEEQMEDTVYSRLKPKKKKKELAEELGVSRTTLWRMAKRQSALEQKQREQEISKRRSECLDGTELRNVSGTEAAVISESDTVPGVAGHGQCRTE